MQLTQKQEEGLKIALKRYKDKEKYVVIGGYAGVGKSELIKFIIAALKLGPGEVAYTAYTGKAAEVLRRKGNQGACTLHKLLYDYIPLPQGGFHKKMKTDLGVKVVVVDEVSMVPASMINELLKFDVFCIFSGDPGQLPQIYKNESHTLLDHPHVFLDQITRQAAESEIITLSMKIREGQKIDYGRGKEIAVISKKDLNTGMLTWADIILCAKNATRHNLNNTLRELQGYDINDSPQIGEKLICLTNYWDCLNEEEDALVNGTLGTVTKIFSDVIALPKNIVTNKHLYPVYKINFKPEYSNSQFNLLKVDKQFLKEEKNSMDWKTSYQLGKRHMSHMVPKELTYGYAITAHRAQGSEWDKVLIIEENFPFDREEHRQWLYTAVSRSSKKCVLVR